MFWRDLEKISGIAFRPSLMILPLKGRSQSEIEEDYLRIKSSFLNEVIHANKYLAKGVNILSKQVTHIQSPFKRKVSYLMGFEQHSSPFIIKDDLNSNLSPKILASYFY